MLKSFKSFEPVSNFKEHKKQHQKILKDVQPLLQLSFEFKVFLWFRR